MGEKGKYYRYLNDKSLSAPFTSGICSWNIADSKIFLPDPLFARLSSDESLTVSELDKFLFHPLPSNFLWTGETIVAEAQPEKDYVSVWTWNLIMKKAKESGLTPREVAEKLGLSK